MEQKTEEIFQRIEKKYILTAKQYACLKKRLTPYMQEDQYGLSTICNLYYDTEHYDLIRRSIEKPVYKEKLRLRCYGISDGQSPVFIELKKKFKGIVYKRRISLPLSEAEDLLEKKVQPRAEVNEQILKEINYFLTFYQPQKAIYIAYDRLALYGKENAELRMTFDANIRARKKNLTLEYSQDTTPYFGNGEIVMEIKTGQPYPLWLTDLLTELQIYPSSFSKYGAFYKRKMQMIANKKPNYVK